MIIFRYDKTFEGLLTAVFEAYQRKIFPDQLLADGESAPLFVGTDVHIDTNEEYAARVWRGAERRLSGTARAMVICCWLSELPEADILLFRFFRKTFDTPYMEINFGDPDILELSKIGKRVNGEKHRMLQFLRFQKTEDGTFFAPVEPLYNVLPLAVSHFRDRFADQPWLIYDIRRHYGYYYDLNVVSEISFTDAENHLITGLLDDRLMDKDERLFQKLWKTYFRATAIAERTNPRKQRGDMPVRYWKYLTEKQ
ncbi:MAG: TIGR03915 family putative DNA repair protein [Prevotellaceae bacterium]|jgi:probable DNA metabolism protein|nr:TIGR03915 family putative DNA repair protein [Prevotellaceae bacterium]